MFPLRGSNELSLCKTTVFDGFGNLLRRPQPGLCYPTRGILQNAVFINLHYAYLVDRL